MCFQTVRDSGAQCVKTLFRNKKELCGVGLEPPNRDASRLTEVCLTAAQTQSSATRKHYSHSSSPVLFQIHFVCLPGQCEGEEATQQVSLQTRVTVKQVNRSDPDPFKLMFLSLHGHVLPQALSSLTEGVCELLRSIHIHGLKNDEVLLLKESRRLAEPKDAGTQVGGRPFLVEGVCSVSRTSKAEGRRGHRREEREEGEVKYEC